MDHRNLQHIEVLFSQDRYKEAEKVLLNILDQQSDSEWAQYYLAFCYLRLNKLDEAKQVIDYLLVIDPGELSYINLKAEWEIATNDLNAAEDTAKHLIYSDAGNDDYYFLMARIKYIQRNYDSALEFTEKSLAIDPDKLNALNLRTSIKSQLGDVEEARESIREALQRNPQDAQTIANHGLQLLNEGNVKESLSKFKEALSINPNSEIAQYGMQQAMKSRFWPYKMFYRFALFMSRLSGRNMWFVIIGAYFGLRFLSRLAASNETLQPILTPIIYLIISFFLLSWVLDTFMNMYLLTNPYGRMLLSEEDKLEARICGISFTVGLLFLLVHLISPEPVFMVSGIFFLLYLIPLGSMFNPSDKKKKNYAIYLTVAIGVVGILGIFSFFFTESYSLLTVAGIGIFVYQWIINAFMISDSGRRYN